MNDQEKERQKLVKTLVVIITIMMIYALGRMGMVG